MKREITGRMRREKDRSNMKGEKRNSGRKCDISCLGESWEVKKIIVVGGGEYTFFVQSVS
jgi:hypothetical protein